MEWGAELKMRVQYGMGAGTAYCTLILRKASKKGSAPILDGGRKIGDGIRPVWKGRKEVRAYK